MEQFKQITIVGCGLLGGSFALALRRAGFIGRITGCGGSRGPRLALDLGIIDALESSFEKNEVCKADLIFLAAPIGGIIDFLKSQGSKIKTGAIVTDAGSTKVEIDKIAKASLPDQIIFIGGHPMAGSEQRGIEYSRADLFDGATWALMQDHSIDEASLKILENLIVSLGAKPVLTQPETHDASVALISHLPQLTASALADLLNQENSELPRKLAATGWRDMTRLAGSSWSVWRDICLTNPDQISEAMAALIAQLQSIKDALDIRDFNQLKELFSAANDSVEKQRSIHYRSFEKRDQK